MTASRPRVLVFAGSAREASLNKKLARVAAKAVNDLGGEATFVDLRDFPMPIYEGDLEEREGMPPFARKLRELFVSCDPAPALLQQFDHAQPEFIAVHDIGTDSSRKLLVAVAEATGMGA